MKKGNTKKAYGNYNNRSYDLPQVIDMDTLSYCDDDYLQGILNHLQSEREKLSQEGIDTLPWEVEICYVQREMKIRNTRRSLHEKYVRNNPDNYYDASHSPQEDFEVNGLS